jgi:hypothetical protein
MRRRVAIILLLLGTLSWVGQAASQTNPQQRAVEAMDRNKDGTVGALDFIRWGWESSMAFVLLGAGGWLYRRDLKEKIFATQQFADHLRVIDENMLGVIDRHTEAETEQVSVMREMTTALQRVGNHVQWTQRTCPLTNKDCPFNARQEEG